MAPNIELEKLLNAAKRVEPTNEEKEAQRMSFAYGNAAFENPRITRRMVEEQAELLKKHVE